MAAPQPTERENTPQFPALSVPGVGINFVLKWESRDAAVLRPASYYWFMPHPQ